MVFLSAKGLTESRSSDGDNSVPFDLPGDDGSVDGIEPQREEQRVSVPFGIFRQWAKLQRESFEFLEKALSTMPNSSTPGAPAEPAKQYTFPPELLAKDINNILVSDVRLGLPPGCIAALGHAGVVSAAALKQHMEEGTLTKIPKIGKAKAKVISETLRAFLNAVQAREELAE